MKRHGSWRWNFGVKSCGGKSPWKKSHPHLENATDCSEDTGRTVRAFCVADTSSHERVVLNCQHEHDDDSDSETPQSTLGHLLHRPGICPSPRRSPAHGN